MLYHSLGLIYTYKCVAKCDICGFSCSPDRQEKMNFEDAKRLIKEAKKSGIRLITITGGEPFLYYNEIIELVKLAHHYNMQTTITSNCYWADSYEKAEAYCTELRNNGARSIKISVDDFHNKYVPYENIKNVIKASKVVGLRLIVGCTITKNSMQLKGVLNSFEEEITNIALFQHKCYPLGRAKEKISADNFYYPKNILDDCSDSGCILVTPNGNVYPCGSMCGTIPSRLVGSIHNSSLDELICKASNNPHNKFICKHGVEAYLKELNLKNNDEYVDTCHACYEIFNNSHIKDLDNILERIHNNDKIL